MERQFGSDARAMQRPVRCGFAPGDWSLVMTPAGRLPSPAAAAAARNLTAYFGDTAAGLVVRRVRLDERLGLAMVHYRRGAVTVYCDQDHMPRRGAEDAIAAIMNETRGILGAAFADGDLVRVAFRVHEHGFIPAELHDTLPLVLADDVASFHACACLVSEELADALGYLWTATISYLAPMPARLVARPALPKQLGSGRDLNCPAGVRRRQAACGLCGPPGRRRRCQHRRWRHGSRIPGQRPVVHLDP